MGLKVMVLGSGGREHAIVWKLSQSPMVERIISIPGNGGIELMSKKTNTPPIIRFADIPINDRESILKVAREQSVNLAVIGPELPLVEGIADCFVDENINCFGPGAKASMLEGSKAFTKTLLKENNIPTADFRIFDDYDSARKYVDKKGAPIVVKADGLAAGKGVFVCQSKEEAVEALNKCLTDKVFGSAGEKVVIEELLEGRELSFLSFVDSTAIIPLEPAQDYKRIYDNDKGDNTGGMGAFSPSRLEGRLKKEILSKIIAPVFKALQKRSIQYRGLLYTGLMLTSDGPKVLEFNVRFGDPETQALLPRLKTDLAEVLLACATDKLSNLTLAWNNNPCVCVVLTSRGYPVQHETGHVILGIEEAEKDGAIVFHAGTELSRKDILTAGGRVLNVCALSESLEGARLKAYKAINKIKFNGAHYRKDIAAK